MLKDSNSHPESPKVAETVIEARKSLPDILPVKKVHHLASNPSEQKIQIELTIPIDSGSFTIEDQVPRFIAADQDKLRQVLLNLLTNAIKFTDNGKVSLHVKEVSPPVPLAGEEVRLHFEIRDTGIGNALGSSNRTDKLPYFRRTSQMGPR